MDTICCSFERLKVLGVFGAGVEICPCATFLCLFNQETHYWQGDSSADAVVMSGVRCSGTELTLDQCLHHGKHINCPKGGGRFAAGVSCTQSKKTF